PYSSRGIHPKGSAAPWITDRVYTLSRTGAVTCQPNVVCPLGHRFQLDERKIALGVARENRAGNACSSFDQLPIISRFHGQLALGKRREDHEYMMSVANDVLVANNQLTNPVD